MTLPIVRSAIVEFVILFADTTLAGGDKVVAIAGGDTLTILLEVVAMSVICTKPTIAVQQNQLSVRWLLWTGFDPLLPFKPGNPNARYSGNWIFQIVTLQRVYCPISWPEETLSSNRN
jgi:hypothetical protein